MKFRISIVNFYRQIMMLHVVRQSYVFLFYETDTGIDRIDHRHQVRVRKSVVALFLHLALDCFDESVFGEIVGLTRCYVLEVS